jgi:hypothetical protein
MAVDGGPAALGPATRGPELALPSPGVVRYPQMINCPLGWDLDLVTLSVQPHADRGEPASEIDA